MARLFLLMQPDYRLSRNAYLDNISNQEFSLLRIDNINLRPFFSMDDDRAHAHTMSDIELWTLSDKPNTSNEGLICTPEALQDPFARLRLQATTAARLEVDAKVKKLIIGMMVNRILSTRRLATFTN
jgi:hypothetical protein